MHSANDLSVNKYEHTGVEETMRPERIERKVSSRKPTEKPSRKRKELSTQKM